MTLLFASVALALPLELRLSPGARVEVLRPLVRGRAEVIVHENHEDLAPQVGWTVGTGIHRARAWELGGDQLLALTLEADQTGIEARQTDTGVELFVVPLLSPLPPVPDGRSVLAALAGNVDQSACAMPALALSPLDGSDSHWSVDVLAAPPLLPAWSAAEPAVVRWTELWDTRRLVARANTPEASERAAYRLGALYRGLGQHREAAYYFERSARAGGAHAAVAWFQAARARLEVRDWEAARRHARAAQAAGGPPEMALVAILWAELHTGGEGVLGMGRALASVGLTSEHERLVGVALTRGDCAVEAAPLFQRSQRTAVGAEAALAQVLLADSLLLAGDIPAARRGYAAVPAEGLAEPVRRILRTRTRHLALLELPVERWGSMLPELERSARLPGEAGVENLHLLAQVDARLGLERESVEAWATLVARNPLLASGRVGAALTSAWAGRTERLFAAGRPMDALALHRAVSPEAIATHLADSSPLHAVAIEYARSGLPEQSLAVWRAAAALEGRLELDTRPTVLEMARLYVATGANADALDAVAWLRRHRWADGDELGLLEARAAAGAGDAARARRLFVSLRNSPMRGAEARLRLALLDADGGRCAEAVEPLATAVATPVEGIDPARVLEAQTRCLLATGRPAEAAKAATTVAGLASHDDVRAWAGARAARLEQEASGAVPPLVAKAATQGEGIWGALAREEETQKAWGAQVARRRLP